jgi:hypothetical protein
MLTHFKYLFQGILVRSSKVLFNFKSVMYIPLSIINSDKIVMSSEDKKERKKRIFTYTFCNSGALHFPLTIVENNIYISKMLPTTTAIAQLSFNLI